MSDDAAIRERALSLCIAQSRNPPEVGHGPQHLCGFCRAQIKALREQDRESRAEALEWAAAEASYHHGEPARTKVRNWLRAEARRIREGEER